MYSKVVLGTHLFLPRNEIRDVVSMKHDATAFPKFNKEPIQMYSTKYRGWLGVPLYTYRDHANIAREVIDNRLPGVSCVIPFSSGYKDGQAEIIAKFDESVRNGKSGFLLQAPPGFGKTVVVIKMLSMIQRTALVVVPRSNLVKQWVDRLLEHTDLKRGEIGIAAGGKVSWKGKKVVVGLVHTLALDRFGDEFRHYFGTVAFDEVDRSIPPQTFSPVIEMFPGKFRIGVSATVKRQDAMEIVFEKHLGQVFLRGRNVNRMEPKVLIHMFNGNSGEIYGHSTINQRGMLLSRLAGNDERNALIAFYVRSILNSGRRCVVLSDRIQQLINIRNIILSKNWEKPRDIGYYVRRLPIPKENRREKQRYREVKSAERERVASACKLILATYGMFSIGTDIQDLAGLVYATPMSDTEQSKGRIERELSGKQQPVVVDIVDVRYPMTVRWGSKREWQYRKEGLTIKKVRSKP